MQQEDKTFIEYISFLRDNGFSREANFCFEVAGYLSKLGVDSPLDLLTGQVLSILLHIASSSWEYSLVG